jgi:hypothetical protein
MRGRPMRRSPEINRVERERNHRHGGGQEGYGAQQSGGAHRQSTG